MHSAYQCCTSQKQVHREQAPAATRGQITKLVISNDAIEREPPQTAHRPAHWMARLVKTLKLWRTRAKQRHHLMQLDDHLLSDIGISRAEAEREARKPFWKI